MGFARLRLLLRLGIFAACLLGLGVVSTALLIPLDRFEDMEQLPVATSRSIQGSGVHESISLIDFEGSLQFPLQRPIDDPPSEPAAKPVEIRKPPPPKVEIVLLGTAVDSDADQSTGWISLKGRRPQMVHVGEIVEHIPGEARVKAIDERRIVIEVQESEIVIEMQNSGGRG